MTNPKSKTRAKSKKAGKVIDERDPQSWLFLNPQGQSEEGFTFGVLRKTYKGRTNSAYQFGYRKTHVGSDMRDTDMVKWSPNVERVEVLLPREASDELNDPVTLLQQVDRCATSSETSLLTYLTVPASDCERVHIGWERAREFASWIARERDLAVLAIQHCPGLAGSAFAPHQHLLIVPRIIGKFGLRHAVYDHEILHDDGQALLHALWTDHRETFA